MHGHQCGNWAQAAWAHFRNSTGGEGQGGHCWGGESRATFLINEIGFMPGFWEFSKATTQFRQE